MFTCDSGVGTVHYSELCDFVPDCEDRSDENFCLHVSCSQFTCSNVQCVPFAKLCDTLSDCLDQSDEEDCDTRRLTE